ncbi:MAG: putative LPS assembly protein LptD [Chloroflexota bacterium]
MSGCDRESEVKASFGAGKLALKVLLFSTLFAIFINAASAFQAPASDTLAPASPTRLMLRDSLPASSQDSALIVAKSKSDIDTTVVYYARDSVRFDIQRQVLRLRGAAYVIFRNQRLDAELIEINFKTSILDAYSGKDSTGKLTGFPKFNDAGEEFVGEQISYNFKTRKGTIQGGETKMGEGFYFGKKIKKADETTLFVKEGYYTTCDAPHPHYYFGSPEMKVILQDKIFLDPLVLYVEDMPIFAVPFGLFFPAKSGRQSGIIVPSFFFSRRQGVVFNDLGYYWAASDYWDTRFTTDIYSKTGFRLKNQTRWNKRYSFSGGATVEFGRQRESVDNDFGVDWKLIFRHNQEITPQERLDANIEFTSNNYDRKYTTDINSLIRQNVTSNASYNKTYDNGSSLTASYQRDQNIITGGYSQTIPLGFTLPNYYPFRSPGASGSSSWVRDISVRYSGTAQYSQRHSVEYITAAESGADTLIRDSEQKFIRHTPAISISPKLGYFTLTPSISLTAMNYFRRLTRTFDPTDSSTHDSYENGFYTEYWFSAGFGLSTRLYGVADDRHRLLGLVKPSSLGLRAFRHTYQPTVSFNYTPDFSTPGFGFYDYYTNASGKRVEYSRFATESDFHAPAYLSQNLSYSDVHSFEIKLPGKDTLPDRNLELLRVESNFGYNFTAPEYKLSNLNFRLRTPALTMFDFNSSMTFNPYAEEALPDSAGAPTRTYRRINELKLSRGEGLARLTDFSFQLSINLNSAGKTQATGFGSETEKLKKDSAGLGERFLNRQNEIDAVTDYFGESSPGWTNLTLPWSVALGFNYSYSEPLLKQVTRRFDLTASLNLRLTQTWTINANTRYDFLSKELLTPQIAITKDLHCWDLQFRWYPTGFNRGFYLRFGIKASQLQDLKLEKQSNRLY